MALTLAYAVTDWLKLFVICRPFAYSWDKTIDGKCGDTLKGWLITGIVNLLIDVGVITLPLPVLWRLQMSPGKKIGLTAMFTVGTVFVRRFFDPKSNSAHGLTRFVLQDMCSQHA